MHSHSVLLSKKDVKLLDKRYIYVYIYDMIWCDVMWCDVMWYDMIWYVCVYHVVL